MNPSKCEPLFEASKVLLKESGLARWSDQTFAFVPIYLGNDDCEFEKYWKNSVPRQPKRNWTTTKITPTGKSRRSTQDL